ncbi:MAG: DUF1292 domain-containing protein [Bacillota bacterium]
MDGNGEERTDIVVLIDEEGNEHDFALVDRFQVEINEDDIYEYAILVPVLYPDDGENGEAFDFEEEAYIFRIDNDKGEEILVEVEDEEEWNQIASIWEDRVENIEFDDEEDIY